jgi:hypothetical protein
MFLCFCLCYLEGGDEYGRIRAGQGVSSTAAWR